MAMLHACDHDHFMRALARRVDSSFQLMSHSARRYALAGYSSLRALPAPKLKALSQAVARYCHHLVRLAQCQGLLTHSPRRYQVVNQFEHHSRLD